MRHAAATDCYAALHADFRWQVPAAFNIAEHCCTRWARNTPGATALIIESDDASVQTHPYAELQAEADRLSNALRRLGVGSGDRVAVVMPQRFETAVAHMAIFQLGAVAMPLSMLFGPDALEYRLNDSAARVAVVDENAIANLIAARPACPALRTVVAVGSATGQGDLDWRVALGREKPQFAAVNTSADDAAVLIYTSGTTGPPKGALIPV